jgi:2',3'-cyclic-nucleotide 2'-phosphodiesterase (5'-nucleotidase family)
MIRFSLVILLFIAINSCVYKHYAGSNAQFYKTEILTETDSTLEKSITPYRNKLETAMNTVIGYAEVNLNKEQPESNLGNWAADAVAAQMSIYTGKNIDFATLNYGGLRIPSIPQGAINKGKIYELMPFDNMLVLVEMKGSELEILFKHIIGKGGWPISGNVRLVSDKNGSLKNISISGKEIDPDKIYNIATIDYLANGGDNCDFFIPKKQLATGVFLRDAVIANIEQGHLEGKKINAVKEGRIIIE